jgi:hypothetical protein
MSLPEDISMLKGGEGVDILPNQAGGAVPTADTSALNNEFTEDQQKEIAAAAGAATIITLKDNPKATPEEIAYTAMTASNNVALNLIKKKTDDEIDDFDTNATDEEKAAALKAVELASKDGLFMDKFKSDEERVRALHIVATEAILRKRKENNIMIVERIKTEASRIITAYAADIKSLEQKMVYTEFYHITEGSDKEFFKFNLIIQTKLDEMNNAAAAKKMKVGMYNDIDKYKQQRLKQWNAVYQTTGKKISAQIPIIQESTRSENEIIAQFSRFIYCLPFNLDRLIVIPPINGNLETFKKVLYRLDKIGAMTYKKMAGKDNYRIRKDLSIVFMPSFYSDVKDSKSNLTLFSIFIDINRSNPNQVFILSESTTSNYAVGVFLSSIFSTSDVLKLSPLTMLEPSYIIYPYTRPGLKRGFILSASTDVENVNIPQSLMQKFKIRDLQFNQNYGSALGLAVKPSTTSVGLFTDDAPNVFTIRTSDKSEPRVVNLSKAHPPGSCDGLLDSVSLDKYKKPQFYLGKVIILPGGRTPEDALMVIQLNPDGTHQPLCESKLQGAPDPLGKRDKHEPSEDASTENVEFAQVDVGDVFSIRIPGDNKVVENWKAKKFTKDEAMFLNSTYLRPGVLYGVFEDNWPINLANFLSTLVSSQCMTDTALLTKRECYNCRQFLEKINVYFTNESLQMSLKKDQDQEEFDRYAEQLYGEEDEVPPIHIDSEDAKDATSEEKISHKQVFGDISSYEHTDTIGKTRRAVIIGVNKKSGMYKFYVLSIPSSHADADEEAENAELMKKVKEQLPTKYPDYIFIY